MRQKKELQALSTSASRMDPDSPSLLTLPQSSIIQPTVDAFFAQPLQPSNTLDVSIDDESNLGMSCTTSEEPNLDAPSVTPVIDELPSCSYTSIQLPLCSANHESCTSTTLLFESVLQEIPPITCTADNEQYKLNTAIIAHVDLLEVENAKLKNTIFKAKLTIEDLKDDEFVFFLHWF